MCYTKRTFPTHLGLCGYIYTHKGLIQVKVTFEMIGFSINLFDFVIIQLLLLAKLHPFIQLYK